MSSNEYCQLCDIPFSNRSSFQRHLKRSAWETKHSQLYFKLNPQKADPQASIGGGESSEAAGPLVVPVIPPVVGSAMSDAAHSRESASSQGLEQPIVTSDNISAMRACTSILNPQPAVRTLSQDGLIKRSDYFSMSDDVERVLHGFCKYLALYPQPS
jgi:hypothetical protein